LLDGLLNLIHSGEIEIQIEIERNLHMWSVIKGIETNRQFVCDYINSKDSTEFLNFKNLQIE